MAAMLSDELHRRKMAEFVFVVKMSLIENGVDLADVKLLSIMFGWPSDLHLKL